MDIKDFLSSADVLSDARASDKTSLLRELSRRVPSMLGLSADVVAGDLLKREALGSTGMGNGVALPHARFRDLKKPFGILARLRKPIPFDAIDGRSIDIVFLLLLPSESGGEPLNALACVARKLRDPKALDALRGAKTDGALYRAMVDG